MSKMLDLFKNEKLLEKVAVAETKEDAKKVCAEAGLEMNDADLDEVAGGLSKTAKILIGVGAGVAGATAIGVAGQKLGWWRDAKIAYHGAKGAVQAANAKRADRAASRAANAGEVGAYGDVFMGGKAFDRKVKRDEDAASGPVGGFGELFNN